MRLSITKLGASVLEFKGSKAHWYVDMPCLHINTSSVPIGYLVLMLQSVSSKFRGMNIPRIFLKINILVYLIPPLPVSSNMFLQKQIHVSLKLTNTFKETYVSMIIINGVLQLMGDP